MKLGPHIIHGSEAGMRLALDGLAPVAKFVDGFSGAGPLAGRVPVIIGRATIGGDDQWRHYMGLPAEYYAERLAGHVTHSANAAITHWETGVNEDHRKGPGGEATDPQDVSYRAEFEADVARHIYRAGKLPILGNFAVGNPSGTRAEQRKAWYAYTPALRAAEIYGGLIGLHCYYTIAGWEHPVTTLLDVLSELGLTKTRIIITEAGADMPAWRTRGLDELTYASQLRAFDAALNQWPRVIGATLYTFGGGPEWADHRLDNAPLLLSQLTQYGRDTAATPPPAPIPTPAPTPAPAPSGNLLVNGGFEDAQDGHGWQFFVDSTSVPDKAPTFRIERSERGASPFSRHSGNAGGQIVGQWICYQAGVAQTLDLPAGRYRLSAWGRPWMRKDGRFDLESEDGAVHHWLVGASSVASGGLGYQSTSARGWARLQHEFNHSGGGLRVYVLANMGGIENNWPFDVTAFSFDDVELVRLDAAPPAQARRVRVISSIGLNVRRGPSVTFARVGYLGPGTHLPILETDPSTGWHRVTPDGWISGAAKFVEVE